MNAKHSPARIEYAKAYSLCRLMAPDTNNDIVLMKRLHHVKRQVNLMYGRAGMLAYESYKRWMLDLNPFRGDETPARPLRC